jgi:HTH-type transcriptional regulator/antitoxin HipB
LSSLGDIVILSSYGDIGNIVIQIRTPRDLGLLIRQQRRRLGLNQADLAGRAGVGRQWLVDIERGKAGAELGLILRTLAALDLTLTVRGDDEAGRHPDDAITAIDIDAIVDAAKKPRA